MTTLTSQIVIDTPAGAVWRVIAHQFDRIGDWATAISASMARRADQQPRRSPTDDGSVKVGSMDASLPDKVAVVSGVGPGLGRAPAVRFATAVPTWRSLHGPSRS